MWRGFRVVAILFCLFSSSLVLIIALLCSCVVQTLGGTVSHSFMVICCPLLPTAFRPTTFRPIAFQKKALTLRGGDNGQWSRCHYIGQWSRCHYIVVTTCQGGVGRGISVSCAKPKELQQKNLSLRFLCLGVPYFRG